MGEDCLSNGSNGRIGGGGGGVNTPYGLHLVHVSSFYSMLL